jgi:hypothetical protein
MTQSRLESIIESIVNVIIGSAVGLVSQVIIFYFYDIKVPWSANIGILFWFTMVSIARSYVVRRWFNNRLRKSVKNMIGEVA